MEDLKRMAVFAAVVQAGSMTAAAQQLGMTPSAVSQHIRQLERQAGVTLLHRSTRQIALRTCSRSPEQQNQESQVDELQAGVEQPLAVLPQPPILV